MAKNGHSCTFPCVLTPYVVCVFDLFNYLKPACFDFIDHSGINYHSKRHYFKSCVGKIVVSAPGYGPKKTFNWS